ncbi:MAG: Gfo/Idh/MocA family oxidoreductase [Bacteroidales bacterium]|nr:Gfo/Idh/MocA family oxidoreductase [Bacteroidales bacterium]
MVKIGIVGVGHLGKIHLKCLKQIADIELTGFYDTNPAIAADIESEYAVPHFDDLNQLIARCDALDIVSPTIYHHQLGMQALRQGKHIFLEKPITARLEEAQEIVQYSQQHHLKVQVGHVERFNDAYLNAKKHVGTPLFVESHRLAEFNPRGTDVSVVLDLMIHDIDILLSIIPYPIDSINASGVSVISEQPDIANARINFSNGAVANLTASRIALKKMRKMRLFQPNAYITMDFLQKKTDIMHLRDYQPEDEQDFLPLILDLGEGKGKKRIFIESPDNIQVNAIATELSLFAQSIRNDEPCAVSAEDGYKALQVAYRIMDCMKKQAELAQHNMNII